VRMIGNSNSPNRWKKALGCKTKMANRGNTSRSLSRLSDDRKGINGYGRSMLRRSLLLFCLLMTSLVVSTTVHASELSIAGTLDCSGELHTEGDADQSPGDTERGVPHHHGSCHGHCLVAPVSGPSQTVLDEASSRFRFPASDAFARWSVDPALRPPNA